MLFRKSKKEENENLTSNGDIKDSDRKLTKKPKICLFDIDEDIEGKIKKRI